MSKRAEINRQRRWARKGREDQRRRAEVDRMMADYQRVAEVNDRIILPFLESVMRGELPNPCADGRRGGAWT